MNEYVEAFEIILKQPMEKCVCTRCGEYQIHTAIYCKGCGAKFTYKPKTFFDAILAMYHRGYQNRPFIWYPSYVAAINARNLRKQFGVELKEKFTEYIQNKLDN